MGNEWNYQYNDGRGNLNQIIDPKGIKTTLSYDTSNRVITIKKNDYTTDAVTYSYSYDTTNKKTVVTDPLGHATTYTYDAGGKVTQVKNAVGSTNSATWDANNNQTASLDPSNNASTASYDNYNNVTSVNNPKQANGQPGAKTSYEYTNPAHPYRASSSSSAQGNITSFSYTTSGNLSGTSNGTGTGAVAISSKRQGDPGIDCSAKSGQVCQAVDGKGKTTSYSYDSLGNVTKITPPSPAGAETFTYDSLSRVQTHTYGSGSKVSMTYDNFDRPVTKTWAKDGTTITSTYDKNGNMTQRTDKLGQTSYTYDNYNRVTKLSQSSKPAIEYSYDEAGNLANEKVGSNSTAYGYDAANQISSVTPSQTGKSYTIAYTAGRPTTINVPGGITQTITYDTAGRQTSIKAVKGTKVLTNYTASYIDASGSDRQLMQTEKNLVSGITDTYKYDGLERLIAADGAGTDSSDYTYTYDANGNRTQSSKKRCRQSCLWL